MFKDYTTIKFVNRDNILSKALDIHKQHILRSYKRREERK